MIPEGWRYEELNTVVASLDAGVSVNSEDRPKTDGEVGVLKVSAVTYGYFDATAYKTVLPSEVERLTVIPRRDTIIVSRANTTELVGASAYVDRDYPDLFLPDKLWRISLSDEYSVRWLSYVLASDAVRSHISNRATGTSGSMKNISQEAFLSVPILIPPLSEQRKIAAILSTWDEAIALTEQLIGALQRHKQALMQVLLTGRVRFREFVHTDEYQATDFGSIPADWRYVGIGEIAHPVSDRNVDGGDLPVLSCTKYEGLVDSLSYFGRQIFSDDLSTYKRVRRGQFAYATNHIEEGSIGYQDLYEVALISPMYTVFETTDKVHDAFLYSVLKTELYRHIFEINTSASINRRGSLRWPQFAHIKVPLPEMQEQKAISEVLHTAQELVETYQRLLSHFQAQKRGLMQQLLTGAVRVGVEGE